MRTLQQFHSDGREYTISPEVPQPVTRLAQVLVRAQLRDETTGVAPRFPVRVSTTLEHAIAKAVDGGLAGLSGIPQRIFRDLQVSAYTFPVSLQGERSVPFSTDITLGPQPAFPDAFFAADLGIVDLHRLPVSIYGRVARQEGAALVGVAGAGVRLDGLWRTAPPANAAIPPDAPHLLFLSPGVHLSRDTATALVRAIALNPVGGDMRTLLEDANIGSPRLRVSNGIDLEEGTILQIDISDPGRAEFVTVQNVEGSADPALPVTVTLQYGPRRTHRIGAEVQRVNAVASGADNLLSAELIPGDQLLLAAAMTGLPGSAAIELHGDGIPSEYQLISFFETVTDAEGYYRLPPIGRAGQIALSASNGVDPSILQTVAPDYSREQQAVNFIWS